MNHLFLFISFFHKKFFNKTNVVCCLMFFLVFTADIKAQNISFNPSSPCFPGTGPWSFDTPVGGRNSFVKSNSVFIRWNTGLNRWEIYNNSTLIFFNNFASIPNPPNQFTGTWTAVTGCTIFTLLGSSTQNFLGDIVAVKSNATIISNGASTTSFANNTNFGIYNGTPKTITYTIENSSPNTLNLTGIAPNYVTLTGSTDFSVITPPNPIIPAGGSTTFQIQFNATGANEVKNANVSIVNDNASIGTYTFAITGTKAVIDNKRGNMLSFGGGTQSALSSSVVTTATTNIAMEGWFNLANTGAGNPICLMYNGNNFANGYGLYLLSNKIQILLGGITLLDTGITPAINTWTHLALVRSTTTWFVYQNGVQIGAFGTVPIPPTDNFRVGSNVNGTAEFVNGQVDEVRFWNKNLTPTEIRQNMHLTLAGTESNLTAYYQFNETSGVALDVINGNNLTLTNVTCNASSLSVGGGISKLLSVIMVVAGSEIDLTTTDLEINFNTSSANPNAEVLITEINAEKPFNNTTNVNTTFDTYWVVRSFGTNTGFIFDNIKARILNTNNISNVDTNNPNNLRLFSRATNSGISTWTQISTANTANNITKEINFNNPTNNFLGEFIIGSSSSASFVSTWITTDGTINIPTFTGETYNYNISWTNLTNAGQGNGSASNVATQNYAITGLNNNDTYQIEISGTFPRIFFDFNLQQRSKIRSVLQWGNIAWTSMEHAFLGCDNLISVDGNSPNFTNTTNLSFMFGGATNLNSNLNNWNVSTITNMSNLFYEATNFNGNITNWNTSNVINMSTMFYSATAFNQNISAWNVNNVMGMAGLFGNATAFNQNITTWNTSAVIDMGGMFAGANAFNQNLAGLNVSNVINMINMFDFCGMSRENYDATLIGWASQNVQSNISLGAVGRTYCLAKNARNTLITTKSWTITGDNFTAACSISSARGNALVINGTSTSNMTTTTPISTLTSNFTIESWLYMNSVNYSTLFVNGGSYALIVEDGVYKIYVTGVGVYNTGIAPIMNEWCHVALQHTGTAWNLFVNGSLLYVSGASPTNVPSGAFGIGVGFIGFNRPNMQIDELRFWESAINITQIREKMHLILVGNELTLKAYFQFNETTGNANEIINDNNGTLGSNASFSTSSVAVARGVSHRRNINVGLNTFTGTGLDINFTTAPPDEFVAYRLNGTSFNGISSNNISNSTSCYWIVRQFGTGSVAYNQMNFTIPTNNIISTTDEIMPNNLKLYKRADNSTAPFGTSIASATNASNATKIIQFASMSQSSFSQFEIGSTSSSLPITLLSFEGKRQNENKENVLLKWKTAQEINNKGFEIEISENGIDFNKIAFVDGVGNSNLIMNYELSIMNEKDAYYRLKQIDFDTKFSYSNIIFIKGNENEIKIYPNPSSDFVILENIPQNTKIVINDLVGKVLFETNSLKENLLQLNVKDWTKGIYLVRVGREVRKIVVY